MDHSGKLGRETFPRSEKKRYNNVYLILIIPLFSMHYYCKLFVKITKNFICKKRKINFYLEKRAFFQKIIGFTVDERG
ncbi:hypothetical protein DW094_07885 [Ruminococcaceae bacterium AM07-15]|nr:hypothetical protein DW094_07885 [Ruminococcaceae bacterium AM07-15]